MNRTDKAVLTAFFFVALLGFLLFFLKFAVLYDGDSYFHAAAARLYADGIPQSLPWARFSIMHEGWGDKEFLFHLILVPFVTLVDAPVGARVALALFNACLFTLIAFTGMKWIGRWGLALPFFVYLASPAFLSRAVRLRPELLALLLLILAIHAAGRRRWAILGVICCAFSLGYTASQVIPGLTVIWMLWDRRATGNWTVPLPLAASAGTLIGLFLHPHFPKNLEIWWIQNVRFFEMKDILDVGNEIRPPSLESFIGGNLALVLALAVIFWASRSSPANAATHRDTDRTAPYLLLTTALFLLLYLRMGRMITYAAPLSALAVAALARGRTVGPWLQVGRFRLHIGVCLTVALMVGVPGLLDPKLLQLMDEASGEITNAELRTLSNALPENAKVAATWGDAEIYSFWAPQARYLNVLDPIFMALPYPAEFAAQAAIFAGNEPDIPLVMKELLDSDYIAFDKASYPQALFGRIKGDPRFEVLHEGFNVVARVRPDSTFVLDWTMEPDSTPYPTMLAESGGDYEGFVDLRRLDVTEGCRTLVHELELEEETVTQWSFVSWGPATIAIGDRTFSLDSPGYALPAQRLAVDQRLPSGKHRIVVETCAIDGRAGFYLRRLD